MSAKVDKSGKSEASTAPPGNDEATKLPAVLSFRKIVEISRHKKGKMQISSDGMKWVANEGGRTIVIPTEEIEGVQWSPLGRSCRLRIYIVGGSQVNFEGFATNEFRQIKPYCVKHFDITPELVEVNTSGHNWGVVDFKGSVLRHHRQKKCTFEVPLSAVAQSVIQGKNEVSLLFHEDDTVGQEDEILTEMRIYIPPKANREEGEPRALDEMNQEIIDRAGIGVNASESIFKFEPLMFTTPRGKYGVEMYQKFFKLDGSSFAYKIMYQNITKLFLMPSHDRMHYNFIIGLDPAIRQGRTSYDYLIMRVKSDMPMHAALNLSKEEIEKFGKAIGAEMRGQTYDILWRLFKSLSKRKVVVPGAFRSSQDTHSISCSLKTNFGHLYVLKKSFFFLQKPPTYIRHDQINNVEFKRLEGNATGRIFDIQFTMHDGTEHTFTNINKDDYRPVFNWMKECKLRISNIQESARAASRIGSGSSRDRARQTDYTMHPMGELDGDEDEDDDDEDEDFKAASESDDGADEYATQESSSDSDEDARRKKLDRAKKIAAKKAKRESRDSDDEDDDDDDDDDAMVVEKKKSSTKKTSSKKKKGVKGARSAFSFFDKENRKSVAEKNPDKQFFEIGKIIGQNWKALSEEEKESYNEMATEDKIRYKKEKKAYDLEHPDEASSSKKRKKDKNAPKRAKTSFMIFSQENRAKLKEANPEATFAELAKIVGDKWKSLSAEEKEPYTEKAAKDKIRAKEEKSKYDELHKDDPIEVEEVSAPKSRKRKKDKNAPKRAKTSFMIFSQENRAKLKEANPEATFAELAKIVGDKWKSLSAEEKEPYTEKAAKDKIRAKEEKTKYDIEHKDDPSESEEEPKKKRKKKKKLPGQPKRAKSAYLFFTADKRSEVVENNPERQPKEIMSLLGEAWKALESKDKGKYNDLAAKDKERYKEEMKAFKEKQEAEAEAAKAEEEEEPVPMDSDASSDEDEPLV